MIVGFTGTRRGMSRDQQLRVFSLLQRLTPRRVRHGDCTGGDAEFHEMVFALGIPIDVHPPSEDRYRAFCTTGKITIHQPNDYHTRDRHIVQGSTVLIGAPLNPTNRGGGTWYTMEYAKKKHKKIYRVLRDGTVIVVQRDRTELTWEEENKHG